MIGTPPTLYIIICPHSLRRCVTITNLLCCYLNYSDAPLRGKMSYFPWKCIKFRQISTGYRNVLCYNTHQQFVCRTSYSCVFSPWHSSIRPRHGQKEWWELNHVGNGLPLRTKPPPRYGRDNKTHDLKHLRGNRSLYPVSAHFVFLHLYLRTIVTQRGRGGALC